MDVIEFEKNVDDMRNDLKNSEHLSSNFCTKVDKYSLFKDYIDHVAEQFKYWESNATYRLISHLDADGISSSAIMIKLLTSINRKYTVSILPYLDKPTLEKLKLEDYNYFIFTDLGSGHIDEIGKLFSDKHVLILDHHAIPIETLNKIFDENIDLIDNINCDSILTKLKLNINKNPKLLHVNPHLFNIDGGVEISGSGVTYLMSRRVNKDVDKFAHIAVIGAIGDVQEDNGFKQLNNEILNIAVNTGTIKVIHGLRLFGVQTRPLHKVLEYCTEPYIPGVSGNESGALQFLYSLGINPKSDNSYKKLIHLSESDMQKLVAGLILKSQITDTSKIIGPVYIIKNEKKESPTRDAKEFATLLNACGRMQKASLGIGVCLNVESMKKKAFELSSLYKKEIVKNLKWVESRLNNQSFDEDDGFVEKYGSMYIINAKKSIKPTMIGTTISIISRAPYIDESSYIIGLSRYDDGNTKISLRSKSLNIDLKSFLEKIITKLNLGETGGHHNAAGAIISTMEEDSLISAIKKEIKDRDDKIQL